MARVNIEERLFADIRLNRVGRCLMPIETNLKERALAIGMLAILWRQSQDDKLAAGTRADFASWFDEDENGQFIDTLLVELERAKYIVKDNNRYTISGNSAQLEAQERWADRAKKGGEANRKRIRKKTEKHSNDAESLEKKGELEANLKLEHQAELKLEHQAEHKLSYTTQFNSIQFDSIQLDSSRNEELINSVDDHSHDPLSDGVNPPGQEKNHPALLANSPKPEKSKKEKPAGEVSDGSKVWTAYAMAYEQRMRVPPIRNAKQNALCSQLVQRLGVENAVKIAAFYLTHPNSFYMQNKYPLGLLVKDCEGIYTEFQRGEYVTADRARKASISQQNSSVLEKFIARKQERESRGL